MILDRCPRCGFDNPTIPTIQAGLKVARLPFPQDLKKDYDRFSRGRVTTLKGLQSFTEWLKGEARLSDAWSVENWMKEQGFALASKKVAQYSTEVTFEYLNADARWWEVEAIVYSGEAQTREHPASAGEVEIRAIFDKNGHDVFGKPGHEDEVAREMDGLRDHAYQALKLQLEETEEYIPEVEGSLQGYAAEDNFLYKGFRITKQGNDWVVFYGSNKRYESKSKDAAKKWASAHVADKKPAKLPSPVVTPETMVTRPVSLASTGNGYDYSSVQLDLPEDISKKLIAWGKDNIPDEDLFESSGKDTSKYGREDRPHVTVKFGLTTSDPDDVKKLLEGFGSVKVSFGKTSIFKESPEYDVVYVAIHSADIRELNEILSDNLENEDEHPEYRPHATVAYVRKGKGAQYAGKVVLPGNEVSTTEMSFRPAEGDKEKVSTAAKKLAREGADKLTNEMMTGMIPMFVESEGQDGDHKCSSCNMRVIVSDGEDRAECTIKHSGISLAKGTCAFWAEGEPAVKGDLSELRMDNGTAGYAEVKDAKTKVQCGTCKAYVEASFCTVWKGNVEAWQCCMTWDNPELAEVPESEKKSYAMKKKLSEFKPGDRVKLATIFSRVANKETGTGTAGHFGELVEGDDFVFFSNLSKVYRFMGVDEVEDKAILQQYGAFRSVDIPYSMNKRQMVIVVEREPDLEPALTAKYADLWDSVKQGLTSIAPAVVGLGVWDLAVAYETFKKVMENALAAQAGPRSLDPYLGKKQGYLGRETPTTPSSPTLGESPMANEEFRIGFNELLAFIKEVTPAVVRYAMDQDQPDMLKNLSKMVNTMKDFAKEQRLGQDAFPVDYDRSYVDHNYAPSNRAQQDVWG